MYFDQDNLVRSLYSGAFEAPYWGDFLERLKARTLAHCTSMLVQSAAHDSVGFFTIGQQQPSDLTLSLQKASEAQFRDNRIYTGEELQEIIASSDSTLQTRPLHARAVRSRAEDGVHAWLIAEGGKDIGASTGALLSSLAGHLQVALRTYLTLETERYRAAISGSVIERLRLGWLTLDAQCIILEASDNLEQFMSLEGLLRRGPYNRLVATSRDTNRELSRTVRACAQGNRTGPQAFSLSADPWINMLVCPAPPQRTVVAERAAALVYVRGDGRSEADRCNQLVELFGLLPSEARLAWLLAQATTITQAAQTLGLTVETARNYSKKIYAKTGARGQSELVRIVMTSVVMLD